MSGDSALDIKQEDIFKLERLKKIIDSSDLIKIKNNLNKNDIKFVSLSDIEYPEHLKSIPDAPYGLFYKGDISLLKKTKAVGIVGTRNCTNYGTNNTKLIASLLSEYKITIVSGFAKGIDTSAHVGAIKSGKTIAVFGTSVDVIFPSENKELYRKLLEKENLIVSEYGPGVTGAPWNFPQRNRIISALSDAVLVIEGDLQSGALITARFAIKYGKPLFALPGPIDSPMSSGPNALIKSGVAELLTSVNEIMEKIGEDRQIKLDLKTPCEEPQGLNEIQQNIFKCVSSVSLSFDELLTETKINVQELSKHLSILELRCLIEKSTDGRYVRTN